MRKYASSRVKRKSFYRKSELQMFLLISGGHIGAQKRGTLGICGVAVLGIFSCGVAVNKISACGVAVFLNLTVCDVCVFKSAVFGETKLSAVSQFPF